MSTEEQHTTWKVDPRVRFRRIFDEGVVIHQERAEALVLNDTAMAFLELCDGERTLEEIVGLMGQQYEVNEAELTRDIATFVNALESEGLITRDQSNDKKR